MDLVGEIRAAFPSTAYPGDRVLSDCWCDDCEFSVRNLRGKSWMQLRLEDLNGENAVMSPRAFHYYLPALMCLAVRNPDDSSLASAVTAHFIASDRDPAHHVAAVQETVNRLSMRQRQAVAMFFHWLASQSRQTPLLIEVALKSVMSRRVEPYSNKELMAYFEIRRAENLKPDRRSTKKR